MDHNKAMTAQDRLDLINRVAQWCFDQTETWEEPGLGDGLAYLLWAIASSDDEALDTRITPEKYAHLTSLLKSHPHRLWDELVKAKAII